MAVTRITDYKISYLNSISSGIRYRIEICIGALELAVSLWLDALIQLNPSTHFIDLDTQD
jgi:hypothetical protein